MIRSFFVWSIAGVVAVAIVFHACYYNGNNISISSSNHPPATGVSLSSKLSSSLIFSKHPTDDSNKYDGAYVFSSTDDNSNQLQTFATSTSNGVVTYGGVAVHRHLQTGPIDIPIRINCGGSDYTDKKGIVWKADQYYTGGDKANRCLNAQLWLSPLAGYDCTCRYGDNFFYDIPVKNKTYNLTLYFTELWKTSSKDRIFSIEAEGSVAVTNIDLIAEFGRRFKPGSKSSKVTVTDGSLTIVPLLGSAGQPIITRIEITDWVDGTGPTPTMVPAPSPPVVAAPTVTFNTVRINCGSTTSYTTPSGNVWDPDVHYLDGGLLPFAPCFTDINNTDLDPLFCSERLWSGPPGTTGTYKIPAPPGRYVVRLFFAEVWFQNPNERVFSIYLQNELIQENLDIYATKGYKSAYQISRFAYVVGTGAGANYITIKFVNVKENAKVDAIQISSAFPAPSPVAAPVPVKVPVPVPAPVKVPVPVPAPVKVPVPVVPPINYAPVPLRINSGWNASYVDPITKTTWIADMYFTGGSSFVYSPCPVDFDGTELDILLCSERFYGGGVSTTGGYLIPVPSGTYTVKLLYAETFFSEPNQRIFKVSVQGKLANKNLDIYDTVGSNNVFVMTRTVNVLSNSTYISIDMTNIIENAKINAIEITEYGSGSVSALDAIAAAQLKDED